MDFSNMDLLFKSKKFKYISLGDYLFKKKKTIWIYAENDQRKENEKCSDLKTINGLMFL